MRVQFWGTRGSIAKPGPSTMRYGGNTTCVEVRSSLGTLIVIDCGTGAHPLGQHLLAAKTGKLRGHILISHTHWDHIQGLPFFAPLFVPGNEWDIYGPKGLDQSLRETLAGQMQYTYFPLTPDQLGATIRYHDLVEGAFQIDDVRISTQYLNHPALTLGYRLQADGAAVVHCSDHEPFSHALADGKRELVGQDLRHAEFVRGADLLIHDAQYTAAEYPARKGWGHSTAEYVLKIAQHAGVKQVALTHHDPLRDDAAVDRIVQAAVALLPASETAPRVFAAAEGAIIEIEPAHAGARQRVVEFQATTPVEPALADRSILLGISDPGLAAALSDAIRLEGIRGHFFSSAQEAEKLMATQHPSLVILEQSADSDGLGICRALRSRHGNEMPIVMIAASEDAAAGASAGVTEWLIKPFAPSFVRTKIRAWVLRTACRWIRATLPSDEQRRLASLQELGILDTDPEPRFDRITRLAAALFAVPMAIVSLIDEDRQWFKSCVGLQSRQSHRDEAFCAHVVVSREPMIVPDALQDPRFADNPFVIGEPRIRFYAGYPLILEDGSCIGTLCLLDTRPRTIDSVDTDHLRDLADIALREIAATQPA